MLTEVVQFSVLSLTLEMLHCIYTLPIKLSVLPVLTANKIK